MSPQADFVVSNGTGAAVRSDINGQLAAIVSNSSGASEPATMYAYQWWADTTTGLLKIRNSANSAWVTIGTLASANLGLLPSGSTITAALGSASTPGITFTGDTNTGIFSPGADTLAFVEGGVEAMRITSAGLLGLGTSGPTGLLHTLLSNASATDSAIKGIVAGSVYPGTATQYAGYFKNDSFGVGGAAYGIWAETSSIAYGNTYAGYFKSAGYVYGSSFGIYAETTQPDVSGPGTAYAGYFKALSVGTGTLGIIYGLRVENTAAVGGTSYGALISTVSGPSTVIPFQVNHAGSEAMRINSERELLIGTTTRTANGGVLQVSNGITFPATAVACTDVNTLDDYEEGTWTPTVIGTTTAGTVTYSVRNARYTKIGRTVFVETLLNWSAGTGTGNLRISGLPFTSGSATTTPALALTFCSDIAMTASHILTVRVADNSTQIEFLSYPSGGGAYATVAYDAAGILGVAGSYSV